MKNISDLIARKEYLPMPENVQQELVEIYGERRVEENSLIKKFATGMLSGAISAPLSALAVPIAPGITRAVDGRVRTIQVFNDGPSKLLVRHKHRNNSNKSRSDDPGFFIHDRSSNHRARNTSI